MTIQGALNDLSNLINSSDIPMYYKPSLKKIKETIELEMQPKIGEWIVTGYDYKCTNCEAEINGEINYMSKSKIKYCPYCGIKLEGEWDNNG